MKVTRFKKANRRINFYINNFQYRPPIQVLIDGTFCFEALKRNFQLDEQLKSYLQLETRLLTTPCTIIETEKLGSKLQHVAQRLKSLQLNKCGHEKNPLSGADCIKAIVKENHYVIATQDRDLQEWIRKQVGIALLYLHKVVPHLDEPSEASKKFITRKTKASTKVSSFEDKRLMTIKKKEGLIQEPKLVKSKKIKKVKGPNPLSCKKKKPAGDKDKLRKVQHKTIDRKKKKVNVAKS